MVLLLRESIEKSEFCAAMEALEASFSTFRHEMRRSFAEFESLLVAHINTTSFPPPPTEPTSFSPLSSLPTAAAPSFLKKIDSLSVPPQLTIPIEPIFNHSLTKLEIEIPAAFLPPDLGIAVAEPLPSSMLLSKTQSLAVNDGSDETSLHFPSFLSPSNTQHRLPVSKLECHCYPSWNMTTNRGKSKEFTSLPASHYPDPAPSRCLHIGHNELIVQVFYARAAILWTEEPPGSLFSEHITPIKNLLVDRAPTHVPLAHNKRIFNVGNHILPYGASISLIEGISGNISSATLIISSFSYLYLVNSSVNGGNSWPAQTVRRDNGTGMLLHFSGNLVCGNLQSFDNLTDIILSNQQINENRLALRNVKYMFDSRQLVFISLNDFEEVIYGDNNMYYSPDFGVKKWTKLSLDDVVNLRLYSFYVGLSRWIARRQVMFQLCLVHGICGEKAIGMNDASNMLSFCVCPPGYRKTADDSCKLKITLSNPGRTKFWMLDFVNDGYWSLGMERALFLRVDELETKVTNFIGMNSLMQTMCRVKISLPQPRTPLGYSAQSACKFQFYELFEKNCSDIAGPENAAKHQAFIYLAGSTTAELISMLL